MSDVDEEEFMCGDDEEYDLVNWDVYSMNT